MSILTGPRAAARSGETKSLVIFLHGYGADGQDLFGLAGALAPLLPDTAFRAPNAPERCAVNPMGYQWFPISWIDGSPESAMIEGAKRASATLSAYLDEALEEEGLGADRLALVGFSQGTMVGLDVALRRTEPIAGMVAFSGRYLENPAPATAKPPVLIVHGDADEVIPVKALHEMKARLDGMGVEATAHVSRGIGHGIAPDGLRLAAEFLRRVLA